MRTFYFGYYAHHALWNPQFVVDLFASVAATTFTQGVTKKGTGSIQFKPFEPAFAAVGRNEPISGAAREFVRSYVDMPFLYLTQLLAAGCETILYHGDPRAPGDFNVARAEKLVGPKLKLVDQEEQDSARMIVNECFPELLEAAMREGSDQNDRLDNLMVMYLLVDLLVAAKSGACLYLPYAPTVPDSAAIQAGATKLSQHLPLFSLLQSCKYQGLAVNQPEAITADLVQTLLASPLYRGYSEAQQMFTIVDRPATQTALTVGIRAAEMSAHFSRYMRVRDLIVRLAPPTLELVDKMASQGYGKIALKFWDAVVGYFRQRNENAIFYHDTTFKDHIVSILLNNVGIDTASPEYLWSRMKNA